MKFFRKSILFLLLVNFLVACLPTYAADELDEQCTNECKGSGFEEGHYLPPEPDSKCKEGFDKHPTDEICCCK